MSKGAITFKGFDDLLKRCGDMTIDARKATEEVLKESAKVVETNTRKEAYRYAGRHTSPRGYSTGQMYKTIITNSPIDWNGFTASIHTGFNLKERGGMHSIFLTRGNGNGFKGDTKLKKAISGAETQKQIAEKQAEIMDKYLSIGGKK